MWTHRVFYILMLALSTMFHVLYPHWFAWYLLVFLQLVLPLDFIISLPGILTRRIALSAPRILEQGRQASLVVTVLPGLPLPSGTLVMRLRIKHEDSTDYRGLLCYGAHGSRTGTAIDTSRTGVTALEIRRFKASSLLGLISIPRRFRPSVRVLILPVPVKPPNAVSLPTTTSLRPKPGGGFSEEHDMRPYRPGDPVSGVHWKLSAKHDELIIREPLVPPPHSRLVSVSRWDSPAERDLILSRLLWVSGYLTERGVPFYVKLDDGGATAEIIQPDELTAFLYAALGGAEVPVPANLPARFTWVFRVDARGG